jgi:hypothetical protein
VRHWQQRVLHHLYVSKKKKKKKKMRKKKKKCKVHGLCVLPLTFGTLVLGLFANIDMLGGNSTKSTGGGVNFRITVQAQTMNATTATLATTSAVADVAAPDALWTPSEICDNQKNPFFTIFFFFFFLPRLQLPSDGVGSTVGCHCVGSVVGTGTGFAVCGLVASQEHFDGADALDHRRGCGCIGVVWHRLFDHICAVFEWNWSTFSGGKPTLVLDR